MICEWVQGCLRLIAMIPATLTALPATLWRSDNIQLAVDEDSFLRPQRANRFFVVESASSNGFQLDKHRFPVVASAAVYRSTFAR